MAKGKGIPLSEWSGRGAVGRLHDTIADFNKKTTAQAEQMIRLTKAIVALTVVLIVGLIVQIILAL